MFYVVFLRKAKRNVIVPLEWVDDDEAQLEKFMNYGVNSNQAFRCFYSKKPAVLNTNGIPNFILILMNIQLMVRFFPTMDVTWGKYSSLNVSNLSKTNVFFRKN